MTENERNNNIRRFRCCASRFHISHYNCATVSRRNIPTRSWVNRPGGVETKFPPGRRKREARAMEMGDERSLIKAKVAKGAANLVFFLLFSPPLYLFIYLSISIYLSLFLFFSISLCFCLTASRFSPSFSPFCALFRRVACCVHFVAAIFLQAAPRNSNAHVTSPQSAPHLVASAPPQINCII